MIPDNIQLVKKTVRFIFFLFLNTRQRYNFEGKKNNSPKCDLGIKNVNRIVLRLCVFLLRLRG